MKRLPARAPLSDKPLVAVIWDDAHGAAIGDYSESEIERDFHKPIRYVSFGLLIRRDAAGVTFASEQVGAEFRGLSFVPHGMVHEVIELGLPRRPQAPRVKKTSGESETLHG